MAAMIEKVLRFGPEDALVGILTVPEQPMAGAPALLISNTGMEHRIGPGRMHVELARAAAAAGFMSLRVDLAGLGEGNLPAGIDRVDSRAELVAALDRLQASYGVEHFVALGLCSGAHDAHQLTREEQRVVGAVFLDGYAYPTPKTRWRDFLSRLIEAKRWMRRLDKMLAKLGTRPARQERYELREDDYFVQPTAEQFAADLQGWMQRQVALLYIYTEDARAEYNYTGQLRDRFPALRAYASLEEKLHHDADHTFSRETMRRHLIATVLSWLNQHFGSPAL